MIETTSETSKTAALKEWRGIWREIRESMNDEDLMPSLLDKAEAWLKVRSPEQPTTMIQGINGLFYNYQAETAKRPLLASYMEEKKMLGSFALKQRGWDETTIRNLLGDPDGYKKNRYYSTAAAERLWKLKNVLAAEASPDFHPVRTGTF